MLQARSGQASAIRSATFGPWRGGLFGLVAVLCVGLPALARAADDPAYVVLGPGGVAVARVLVAGPACPVLRVDGHPLAMTVRAAASIEPQRPTASSASASKPSAFPVLTCERALPAGARVVRQADRRLPLPPALVRRIVVIGDTGCRLKAADNAWQGCNDPAAYPFAAIAARAAAWRPDLVIHVGDLVYRENPCPEGQAGCAGSPWGYGYDAWRADFFDPGGPLLAAAPWIFARGNHESCFRAGQGWWRFIDPAPLEAGRDCNDPASDAAGDTGPTFAVPLGGRAQVVVMDLSNVGGKPLAEADPRAAQVRAALEAAGSLAADADFTFAIDHYPMLGVSGEISDGAVRVRPGNPAIQSAFGEEGALPLSPRLDVLLAGHVHLWQQASFSGSFPSQFIAGFSGTFEDRVPLPEALTGVEPTPGALIDHFSSWTDGFGYMTLERLTTRRWRVVIRDTQGRVVNRCRVDGRQSRCDRSHVGPADQTR